MSESIIIGIIVAVSTLLGSLITGIFAFIISRKKNKEELLKKKLKISILDNLAFYELEKRYTLEISKFDKGKTPVSIKKKFRKELREEQIPSPSKYAVPKELNKELVKYD